MTKVTETLTSKAALAVNETGEITGLAWPFSGPDSTGDIIEPGAFTIPSQLPICLEHDKSKAIGVWETITETDKGLEVKGRLFLEGITTAKSAHRNLKSGVITGLSISFNNGAYVPLPNGQRSFKSVALTEISLCQNPVHPEARISAVKSQSMNQEITHMENTNLAEVAEVKTTANDRTENKSLGTAVDGTENKEVVAIKSRLDKIEARDQRLNVSGEKSGAAENKAYLEAMRTGGFNIGGVNKALTIAGDAPGYILVPEQIQRDFLHNLLDYSPIRSVADVRQAASHTVKIPIRTGVTNAAWVGETAARTASEPSFDQMDISIKEVGTFVDISLQAMEDSDVAMSEITNALSEDFGEKEDRALVIGGAGALAATEPQGILTNTAIPVFNNGHAANLSADALIRMIYTDSVAQIV